MLQGRKKGGGQDHRRGLVNFNRRRVVNLVGVSIKSEQSVNRIRASSFLAMGSGTVNKV
jgi:hypothetical protein